MTLTHLGKLAIVSKDPDEAESLLRRAIQFSLETQAMPQAIHAALELVGCLLQKGSVTGAVELVFSAMEHPASTEAVKKQIEELREVIKSNDSLCLPEENDRGRPIEAILPSIID